MPEKDKRKFGVGSNNPDVVDNTEPLTLPLGYNLLYPVKAVDKQVMTTNEFSIVGFVISYSPRPSCLKTTTRSPERGARALSDRNAKWSYGGEQWPCAYRTIVNVVDTTAII